MKVRKVPQEHVVPLRDANEKFRSAKAASAIAFDKYSAMADKVRNAMLLPVGDATFSDDQEYVVINSTRRLPR